MKILFALLLTALEVFNLASASAADFKVLVVMGYEEKNPWVREIREGIDSVLRASSAITYFHLNAQAERESGAKQAAEAFSLYQRLAPDGVIAADDAAQILFVVPYLKNKVSTPVIFTAINAGPEEYGFPTPHISGVLERTHVRETLAFAKQLVPSIKSVCFVTNNVPPGIALRAQVDLEKSSYPTTVGGFYLINSVAELEMQGKVLRANCDAVQIASLAGILDRDAKPLTLGGAIKMLAGVFGGPILGSNRAQVEQGAWAAVIKTGQEQGETSAQMLLDAMRGTPMAKIPVTQNMRGERVINVSAIESNKIMLRPLVIRGATLIRQQP
ncbi:MAG: ABC transporter substrate-binding protein [Burkholderiales bacterium]